MQRWTCLGVIAMFVCLASGCGNGPSPVQEQAAALSEAGDVLATVKDKASAQAAQPKIHAIAARLREARRKQVEHAERDAKAGKWKEPTEDEKKQLVLAMTKYVLEMRRLSKGPIDGGAELIWELATAVEGLPESAAK
jgi:hypothetical protein